MRGKKFISVFLILCAIALTGCAGSAQTDNNAAAAGESANSTEAAVTMNAEELAERLLNEIEYKDELLPLDFEKASVFIDFSGADVVNAYVYETAGATTEEIVVVECSDSANADKLIVAFQNRVKEQIETYQDYAPDEVEKLKAAYLAEIDNVAILSVSDSPDKAKEIVSAYAN